MFQRRTWHLVATSAMAVATACCSAPNRPGGFLVSSTGSDYSPVLRAHVVLDISSESVVVRIDSGLLLAPGEGARRALMRGITIEALLARAPGRNHGPLPTPWTPLDSTPPSAVAESLAIGVPVALPTMRLGMPRPPALQLDRTWLVFRIRADGEATPVRLADGRILPGRRVAGGVRVFACADRSLSGRVDRKRRARLRRDYLAACQPSEVAATGRPPEPEP